MVDNFRDQLIAASLKLIGDNLRLGENIDFRDQLIAASLKLPVAALRWRGMAISAIN